MGQISSLVTSTELTGHASSSKSSQRSKKSRDATKVHKAEDVPLYKGDCSVDELVEYIRNGTDPTVTKSTGDTAVSATRGAALVPAASDRREQPPPLATKQAVKKRLPLKKDPTESDSGCGDCITADHQKDLLNSVDMQPLGCSVVEDDIVAMVTPAVVSLLNTVRSDVGALYDGGSLADYDIETYTGDSMSSFVPSTEDEFMIVQRRRKGMRTTTMPASNGVEIKSGHQLGKLSNSRSVGVHTKQAALVSSGSLTNNDIVAPVLAGATIDAIPSSLESVSSYASANSSIRSNSPIELYSVDADTPIPSSDDVSVDPIQTSFSVPGDDNACDLTSLSVFSDVTSEERDLEEASASRGVVEISNDQRLFESMSARPFCFFAADESSDVIIVTDDASSSVQTRLGNETIAVVQMPPVLVIPTIQNVRVSPQLSVVRKASGSNDQPVRHVDSLPRKLVQRPWSGLDEFSSVGDDYKSSFLMRSPRSYCASCEFTFGSIDFIPFVCHSHTILPLTSLRCSESTKKKKVPTATLR